MESDVNKLLFGGLQWIVWPNPEAALVITQHRGSVEIRQGSAVVTIPSDHVAVIQAASAREAAEPIVKK